MQEYVAAPFVCGDKSKAPFREPSINDSIMETTGRGLVRIMLIAVLVGGEGRLLEEGYLGFGLAPRGMLCHTLCP